MKRRGFLGALGAIVGAPAAAAVATKVADSQEKFKGLSGPGVPEPVKVRNICDGADRLSYYETCCSAMPSVDWKNFQYPK